MRLLLCLPLLACTSSVDNHDVVGPFTGPIHRYAISSYALPRTSTEARVSGDDLDGDGAVDNQLGLVFATLATGMNLAGEDGVVAMWQGGLLPSALEIQADSLDDDPTVAVSYLGRPGDTAVPAAGAFVGGVFTSNRSRTTTHPAQGTLVLPILVDADPMELVLTRGEIDLQPTATGYHALIRGEIDSEAAKLSAATSLVAMVEANPHDHPGLARGLDSNHDGHFSVEEALATQLIQALLAPDLDAEHLSIGFAVDLIPCDAGTCAGPASPSCLDRIQDGTETGVDCGGACRPCSAGVTCIAASDCDSGVCDGTVCAAGTCSDHRQDDLEAGVDCGAPYCLGCAGESCSSGTTCASAVCGSDGTCR
jgi:hypothetical protein